MADSLHELFAKLPQTGKVTWIGIRPERKAPMIVLNEVFAHQGKGLEGDRYNSKNGKRQVTLIQAEHIAAIQSFLNLSNLDPALLRRNIVVSGINLLALKDKQFYVGDTLLEYTGLCHPCSAMEATFGEGSYNAVRGHGGVTARIITSGSIQLGNVVRAI